MQETFRKTRGLIQPLPGLRKVKKEEMARTVEYGDRSFFSQESSGFHDDFHCSLYTYRRSDGARSRRKASCVGRAIPWRPLAFFIVLYSFSTTAVFSIPFQPPSVYRVFQKLRLDEHTRVLRKSLMALAVPFLNSLILWHKYTINVRFSKSKSLDSVCSFIAREPYNK